VGGGAAAELAPAGGGGTGAKAIALGAAVLGTGTVGNPDLTAPAGGGGGTVCSDERGGAGTPSGPVDTCPGTIAC
jgi:hypothetical protein